MPEISRFFNRPLNRRICVFDEVFYSFGPALSSSFTMSGRPCNRACLSAVHWSLAWTSAPCSTSSLTNPVELPSDAVINGVHPLLVLAFASASLSSKAFTISNEPAGPVPPSTASRRSHSSRQRLPPEPAGRLRSRPFLGPRCLNQWGSAVIVLGIDICPLNTNSLRASMLPFLTA